MVTDSVPSEEITTTTDHETIRTWVEQRGSRPARVNEPAGDSASLAIIPKGKADDSLAPISWDEFFTIFEDEDVAFAYQTEKADANAKWFCQFVTRDAQRADAEIIEAESDSGWRLEDTTGTERHVHQHSTPEVGLEEGDTAETSITRRKIVEREIVETDRIRSRVANCETIEETVLDSEIIDMEVDRCEILDDMSIETEIVTRAAIRTELHERYLVESTLVERDIVERELTEGEGVAGEAVERETVEGEVFDDPTSRRTVVESEAVRRAIEEHEFEADETIETAVLARRIVESEVVERLLVTTTLAGGEVIDHEFVESEVIDMRIVEENPDRGKHPDEGSATAFESTATGTESRDSPDADSESAGPTAIDVEEGKDVLTASGDRIGRVAAVHDGLLYVDTDADLTETVASRFDWGDSDEAVPIELERVDHVTETAVHLSEFAARP